MTERDVPSSHYDEDDSNPSNTPAVPTIGDVIDARLSRRAALKGLLASAAVTGIGLVGGGLVAKAAQAQAAAGAAGSGLTFKPVPHGYDAQHHIAEGYRADVLIRWGDKVAADAPDFDVTKQSADAQAKQFGYNCDFITYLPLPEGQNGSEHGLLVVNHEYTMPELMFPGFADNKVALEKITKEQTEIEMAAHGASVIEVKKTNGKWAVVEGSKYARRITGMTPMRVSGPAAGDERLKTKADPTGTTVLGTLNNCAGGWTPWGTALIAEENFNGYFGGDAAAQPQAAAYKRYGISKDSWYSWWKYHDRFDVSKEPNEPNRFGWMVEVDPYDPASTPVKRTSLGRFKHEGATTIVNGDGRVVVYSGDDERFDYVYKFVSEGKYDPANRAANRDLLDRGTLYVGKFHDDGKLEWMPMVHGQGKLTAENGFNSQADVLIEARRAADLLGATPMDRPEDVQPNPVTGLVYVMLTNNSRRKADQLNAANPRAENKWGQIVEMVPPGSDGKRDHAADTFQWNIFLLAGDPKDEKVGAKYGGDVGESGWFNCPDNVEFDPKGRIWIATDGFTDAKIADGLWAAETQGEGRAVTKRFFACPSGAEMCGPRFTPDGKTLFLAVQHPGDDKGSNFDAPSTRWPDFKDGMPPRPSLLVVTKEDGGEIGA
ncbi:MAG TPA: PhoX family phosphatase [Alphaproteobacteria bacterium]|nr:PhoX family phosphatase [Alphaproteobacteria bacterium]